MAKYKYVLNHYKNINTVISTADMYSLMLKLNKDRSIRLYSALDRHVALCYSYKHWIVSPIALTNKSLVVSSAKYALHTHSNFDFEQHKLSLIIKFSENRNRVLVFSAHVESANH
jgi:hypothetical protein